ncbi:MAG: hypothetical protein KDD82_15940 [Planctomycetes bacterium]|nr:hypothetical protein [Planctomycetota bacterium]
MDVRAWIACAWCLASPALGAPEVFYLRGVRDQRAFTGTLELDGERFSLVRHFADGAQETWKGTARPRAGSLTLERRDTPRVRTYVYLDDPAAGERGFYRQRGVDYERAVAAAGLTDATPRVGCVLMVEDEGWGRKAITEPLGAALYGDLLRQGPYATVRVVVGRADGGARLAATLRELAADHDQLDVFLSIHTTQRDPAAWAAAVGPEAARKLRLVYSTACYGNDVAREAWERLGPQAVVTHVGENNPVIALPFLLSEWVRGRPLGESVRDGYRKTVALERLVQALPSGAKLAEAMIPARESQPVISGDAGLRIATGRAFARSVPGRQCFDARGAGALGVALETLGRGGYTLDAARLRQAPALLGALPPGLPEVLERARIVPDGLQLELRARASITLYGSLALRLEPATSVTVRTFDLERGRIDLRVRGVSGVWGGVQFTARGFELRRLPLVGWVVTVRTGAAPIPIPLGGRAPVRVSREVDALLRPGSLPLQQQK